MKKLLQAAHVYRALILICLASFIFSFGTLVSHIAYKNRVIREAKNGVQIETNALIAELESTITGFKNTAEGLCQDLTVGALNDRELAKRLEETVSANGSVVKFGLVTPAVASDGSASYRMVYYQRQEGKVRPQEATGPQEVVKGQWLGRSAFGGAGWSDPFFDETLKGYSVIYSTPYYPSKTAKEPSGVVSLTMSLGWLKDKMDALYLKKKDFGVVLSKNGNILYHPAYDFVLDRSNIFETLKRGRPNSKNYERQRLIMQKAANGESGEGFNLVRTGQSFWYFYRPIRSTGWSVVVNFMNDAIPFNEKAMRRQQIRFALGLICFVVSLVTLIFGFHERRGLKKDELWWLSILFSVLCILSAGYTWALALCTPLTEYQRNRTVIDDPVSLNKFLATRTELSKAFYGKEPVFVPTGIYIQSLEFTSSNNVSISGYVWQRYAKELFGGPPKGFILPEATHFVCTEAYRLDEGKQEVIGWYFEATIRQSFDYSRYPFDHPNIAIWMRHKDFLHNIALVPDLKSYPLTNAVGLPGLRPGLALPGYSFFGTFFSYESKMNNTTFGQPLGKQEFISPEFFYHILVKRNFINPLVSKFFPILIVVSMLFIVILSFSADAERQKNFGLTGLAVVGLVVSFFFTTLLNQIDLRQQYGTDGIIFIENFNFITYMILLMSAVQAFLFAAGKKLKFIQYEHCLIPKLMYWPIYTGLVLGISLAYFY